MVSTNFASVESALRQRLADNIGDVPVLYDNMPKTGVQDEQGQMPDEFVHITIYAMDHNIKTIGSTQNRVRYSGVFDVNIFTPIAQGDGRNAEIMDVVAGIFNNALFGRIHTRLQGVQDVGASGQYWQGVVAVTFEADYTE